MDKRNTSSSLSQQQQNQIEEETTTSYRSKNTISTEDFYSYGIPLKSGSRLAAIQENREREKRELSHLNDRFASYIERVRFLEAQNKKLQIEIDHLRGKWGLQTNKLKEKYDVEIREARHILDTTAKDRAAADLRVKRAEEERLKLKEKCELLLAGRDSDRQKIELLQKELFDNEADLKLFHRRLIDLEDEQKRHHNKSEKLILDIQRITKALDHETITRIQLENQKQSLEEEIHFLKEIHLQEIEELKQINLIGTKLDPTNFFKHELSNAVKNIREEYEQLNQQQQNEFQSWYQLKVTQAIQEIQSHRAMEKSEHIREQEEIKKLRTLVSDSQQNIIKMRERNEELENRIQDLEKLIQIERNNNIQAADQRDRKIKDLRIRLEDLGRDYNELISTKSSLDSEIAIYRQLLDGEEKRDGLKQIVANVENQLRTSESTTCSRSYQKTGDASQELEEQSSTDRDINIGCENSSSGGAYHLSPISSSSEDNERKPSTIHEESIRFQDRSESSDRATDYDSSIDDPNERFGNNDVMLKSHVPYQSLSSTRTESTIFDQVYGGRRQRPTTICSSIEWTPVVDRSSTNRWNTSDIINRKLKKKTFFETGSRQEQQQSKAVTPPSSDYTDAYLNAFAPKPFSTRRVYRITAPVFTNVPSIKTYLSTDSSIKTSQTRFNNINNNQTSNSFDKIVSSFPTSSSTCSSSFIPDISPKYEPVSSTSSSLFETQTYNVNDSTQFRNHQSFETTIHIVPRPSSPAIATIYSTPLSSSSIISTYKPSVSFQSVPLSFSNNIRQTSTNEKTVLSSSNTEKQINRPETLLFQHDEDIRSSCIEKSSPIITPLLESPITHVESKIEQERTSTEELSIASSKPIQILENTINKYDAIIDQISEVLASVSPLSSTMSSMSPGKSVLDYELTFDGSPILQRKPIEPQSSQQSTVSIRNTNVPRVKVKYLIRDDSYEKIMTAIADLDDELTPPPDIQKSSTVIEEEKEEPIIPSLQDHQISSSANQLKDEVKTLLFDKYPTPSLSNEMKEEAEVLLPDKQQLLSITENEERKHQTSLTSPSDVVTSEVFPLNGTKLDEKKFVNVQSITGTSLDNAGFVQEPTEVLSKVAIVETTPEENSGSNDEVISNENNEKHVKWDKIVVNNEDNESSSYPSSTGEDSLSEASIAITEKKRLTSHESTTVVEQQINPFLSIKPSKSNDQQVSSRDSSEPSTNLIERQIKSSSSPEMSSSFSDSLHPETTPSDLNESRSSHDEQITSSRSSVDTEFVSTIDLSNKNTSTVDEQLSTISDVVSKENTDLQVEETESIETETPLQLVDVTESEVRTSTTKSTSLLSLPIIESPIHTLTDSISTRYISSDVYHGYLGDHRQFIESPSNIDTEHMKILLLASLRQTIATSATPIIETIQSVVSSRRTLIATQPWKNENEVIDHHQNETILVTAMAADSKEENNEYGTQIEENKSPVRAFEESTTMFESLRDTITDSQSIIVSNIQADKQEVLSKWSSEPVSEILTSTEDVKNLIALESTPPTDTTGSSIEKLDDHSINDIELTSSSLFDSIQDKVSDAITTTVTETIQNVVSADVLSIQTQTAEEPILVSLPLDILHKESIDNPMSATSSMNITTPVILTLSSAEDKTTESNTTQNDEQISAESIISFEYTPTANTQEIIENMPVNPNAEELASTKGKITEGIVPIPIVQDEEQVLTTTAVLSEPIDTEDKGEVIQVNFTSEASDFNTSEQKTNDIKTSLDETTHLLAAIIKKIDSVISSSSTEENLPLIEQDFAPMNNHTNNEQVTSTDTIRNQPSSSQEKEQALTLQKSEFYADDEILHEDTINPTTVLSQISNDETAQSTTHQQPSDAVATEITSTKPITTEFSSTFETNEFMSASNNDNEIILKTIHDLVNKISQTVLLQLQQNSIETNQEILSSNSTSPKIEIENHPSKSSMNFRELSPTNTELDSLELIYVLQHHSIVLPNSSGQLFSPSEKSPSTTTSSQITSSDRYVSYAIHQMNDSSQERLPSFPIADDIPIDKNLEKNILSKPFHNQSIIKEDDSTEFDATDNLTSYSDDIILQGLQRSTINRKMNFDTSSTDDDVDEEIEQHDLTDLECIIDKLTQLNNSLNINEEAYQRYDLATTPSSNDSSSSSRQQPDDIYFIPGYSGLWRPSTDNENANLSIDYDADDERKTTPKTRTIVRTLNSTKRPLLLHPYYNQVYSKNLTIGIPLQSDTKEILNRSLNELRFDISESDSYQTCPSSSISKQEKNQISSEENIFLIRESTRGVSLPITMKIDCDNMALRLSTSLPISTQLYSTIQPDLSSSSTHNEPSLPIKTDSHSVPSSPSSIDQQKLPSWLNTINTVTTTTEESNEPFSSRITLLKSAKGPISISECHPQGYYIIIENTSQSKNIDLINWKIQQENDNGDNLIFTFSDHCLLRPNHSLKILTKTSQSEQRNDDLIALSLFSWYTGQNIFTTLINPEGKTCATLTKKTIFSS